MRGFSSLFTKEGNARKYGTGLFVASAEADVISKAKPEIAKRWPAVKFTYLAAEGHADEFQGEKDVLWLERVKLTPLRSLAELRRRRFDLCIVLWSGRPTFRKLKLAPWLVNASRVVVYNEHGGSVVVDRVHWKQLLAHMSRRVRRSHPYTLFFPFGLVYLLGRTFWLSARARLVARRG